MIFGSFDVEIKSEMKKCFFKTKDNKSGLLIHRAAFICLTHEKGDKVVFKITKKHNHYDSRDKKVKTVPASFVKAELSRMLGKDRGEAIYESAISRV